MTKLMHFQFLHKFGLKDMDLGTNPECHLVKIPLDILYRTQSLNIHPETMPWDTIPLEIPAGAFIKLGQNTSKTKCIGTKYLKSKCFQTKYLWSKYHYPCPY